MSKLFPFPPARRARPWTRIAVLGLAVLSSAPALASDCPRGQIFWKSKKTCVDKAEAAKLGFYHGHVPKRNEAKDKPADAAQDKPAEAAKDKPTPGADAPAAEIPPPAAPETPLVQPAAEALAPATPSPYGELPIDEFAKAK
ncbi:hypothetical protein K9U39_15480 [Rhodoblastus acidophilus]|uniref:Uncharacterized protein n=1 Tax=Candidatus Rhodoblastus alkanivorans TaxID=2954117 RepID=A0ABS9Z0U7_9HYPH|nr:hypothetical protein [Candidatus Rhodoblastus alkanivorans]MCI4678230.1 hypothetical protein [Candidatus Rhodoblastus alkanivorans]MCI4681280.1 hypothetical protein [Candidatus Rhodoblastus alkanivorans]MDI4642327.1 hypothetical protein [Rhodoblastus acidophilus]